MLTAKQIIGIEFNDIDKLLDESLRTIKWIREYLDLEKEINEFFEQPSLLQDTNELDSLSKRFARVTHYIEKYSKLNKYEK